MARRGRQKFNTGFQKDQRPRFWASTTCPTGASKQTSHASWKNEINMFAKQICDKFKKNKVLTSFLFAVSKAIKNSCFLWLFFWKSTETCQQIIWKSINKYLTMFNSAKILPKSIKIQPKIEFRRGRAGKGVFGGVWDGFSSSLKAKMVPN